MSVNHKTITVVYRGAVTPMIDVEIRLNFFQISLFHRAFFITIVSLPPTHALVLSYTKIT